MLKRFMYTLLLLFFAINTSTYAKTAVLVIAHRDYQQVEYNDTKRLLEQAGIKVITASNKAGTAIGADGSRTAIDKTVAEKPGSIIQLSDTGIDVSTGKGILRVKQLQFPGGKPLDVSAVLNSKRDFFMSYGSFEQDIQNL